MIVKNEAAFLEGCLSSLLGHVDEIVIVDTGSSDETLDIARKFDCTLLQQAWRNDFSAARNTALENATSDWILYIDADERIGCPDGVTLRDLLPGTETAAARVRFQPRSDMTSYGEMRLFRRDQRIRFQGAMHETMIPAIELVCREDRLAIARQYEVSLVHLGYDGDQSHTRRLYDTRPVLTGLPTRPVMFSGRGVTSGQYARECLQRAKRSVRTDIEC